MGVCRFEGEQNGGAVCPDGVVGRSARLPRLSTLRPQHSQSEPAASLVAADSSEQEVARVEVCDVDVAQQDGAPFLLAQVQSHIVSGLGRVHRMPMSESAYSLRSMRSSPSLEVDENIGAICAREDEHIGACATKEKIVSAPAVEGVLAAAAE